MALRIRELRRIRRMTIEKLAEVSGLSTSYLSRLERGERHYNEKSLAKIAAALRVTPEDLFSPTPLKGSISLLTIEVIGSVQAGVWVEAMEWPNEDRFSITVPAIPKASQAFGLKVNGPSMNKVFAEGAIAICVPILDFWRDLKSGDYVISQRRRADDGVEATMKELVLEADGSAWLWPRSTDPRHQSPIEVFLHQQPNENDETRDIHIIAVVVGVYQNTILP